MERRHLKAFADPALLDLDARLGGRPPDVQLALARGIGSALRNLGRGPPEERELLHRLLINVERGGHALAPALVEGLCLDLDFTLSHEVDDRLDKSFAIAERVPASLMGAYRRGLGIQIGRLAARGIEADLASVRRVLAALPPATRADIGFGFGWGFGELSPAAQLADALNTSGQPALLTDALHGAGACRRHLDGPESVPESSAGLDAASLSAFEAGRRWPNYPGRWTGP